VRAAAAGFRRVWWVFVASALPWVVDWTAPYGTAQLLAGVLGAAAVAWTIAYTALRHLLYEIGTGPSVGDTMRLRVDARNPRRHCLDPTELSRR